ncbi:MAG: STAS domain-containing protein [Actinobacteria bacterium]|nr:STAS domain-containing protein [Actinomycetota bacterium]
MDTAIGYGFGVRCDTASEPTLVSVHGELDAHTSREVLARVTERLAEAEGCVDLDLSAVTFLDSGGLRALALLAALGSGRRGGLRLVDPSAPVRRVLALTGKSHRFTVAP